MLNRPSLSFILFGIIGLCVLGASVVAVVTVSRSGSDEAPWYALLRPTFLGKTQKTARKSTHHRAVLTEKGFVPQELDVSSGDTVVFETTLARPFWPASDLHPSHELYPSFDPRSPIPQKEQWTFRFDQTGTWRYHDHLAPYFTGTIVVAEIAQASRPEQCDGNDTVACWERLLVAALTEKGLDASLDLIKQLYQTRPQFATSCHYLTHNLGIATYARLGKGNGENITLPPETVTCAAGFYHGFMEAFLSARSDPQEAREFCDAIEQKLKTAAPDAGLQCYHGIGHGAMDLIVRTVERGDENTFVRKGLAICEKTSLAESPLYRCASGVFNGLANYYIQKSHGLSLNQEDPLAICHEQPERYRESCYGNMNSALLWLVQNDFSKAVGFLETIPEEQYAIPATQYLANLAVPFFVRDHRQEGLRVCRMLKNALRIPCIEGIAKGFLEHGTPGEEYRDALDFCRSSFLTEEERKTCFSHILSQLSGWYSPQKSRMICDTIEKPYQKHCLTI